MPRGIYERKGHSEECKANISAALKGRTRSAEHAANISESLKGKTLSDEHKASISNSLMGRKRPAEVGAKISESRKGIQFSDEHRINISKANKRRKHSEETKAKMAAAHKGTIFSEERKANISSALKGKKHSEEARVNNAKAQRGKKLSDEHKAKISAGGKGRQVSGETKAKMSKTMKEMTQKYWDGIPKEDRADKIRNWIDAGIKARSSYTVSSIEKAICEVLDGTGIVYETQKRVGRWYADIYIPGKNLVVECNGDYWHNLPQRKKRDKELQKYCDAQGIKLIWLWEHEIKTNPRLALAKGMASIQ